MYPSTFILRFRRAGVCPKETQKKLLQRFREALSISSCIMAVSGMDCRVTTNRATGVCEKNTPPEQKTHGKLRFQNTKSEAGEQFLLLCRKAEALAKRTFVHRHQYSYGD